MQIRKVKDNSHADSMLSSGNTKPKILKEGKESSYVDPMLSSGTTKRSTKNISHTEPRSKKVQGHAFFIDEL